MFQNTLIFLHNNNKLLLFIILSVLLLLSIRFNTYFLKYIILSFVIFLIYPHLQGNFYSNILILLFSIMIVDMFYNNFINYKSEHYQNVIKDDGDDKNEQYASDQEIIFQENTKIEPENERVRDNDINKGIIENVSYADANYKYKMSDLDGMVLEKKNEWRIMPKPESVPLSKKREYIVQGHDVPLNSMMSREERLDNIKPPFVDGVKGSKRSMVMFDSNVVSLQCCPSTWSTDRGCVCFSSEQRDFINKRGGNRTFSPDQI